MDRIEAMRIYCAVIEAGGFSAAAERLGLSTSATSRLVAQLEAHLNARLLHRTTRKVTPTEAGQAYFERCLQLLADIEETETLVAGEAYQAKGRLRLTAPTSLAIHRLAPAFSAFTEAFPSVELDLVLSDYAVAFEEEGVDLAVRVGSLASDSVIARRIGTARLLLAASPAYLARTQRPQAPEHLGEHRALLYSFSSTGAYWQLRNRSGEERSVRVKGPVTANNGMLLAELAAAGCGITSAPDFLLQPLIAAGRLVELLPEWNHWLLPIHAVYPTRRHLSAKVQAMIRFLESWFSSERG